MYEGYQKEERERETGGNTKKK